MADVRNGFLVIIMALASDTFYSLPIFVMGGVAANFANGASVFSNSREGRHSKTVASAGTRDTVGREERQQLWSDYIYDADITFPSCK